MIYNYLCDFLLNESINYESLSLTNSLGQISSVQTNDCFKLKIILL